MLRRLDRLEIAARPDEMNVPGFDFHPLPLCRAAVLRLPHRALSKESSAQQGITTDSSDSTSFWIGSYSVDATSHVT